jgi:uncharacterized membrane protein YccC
LILVFGGVGEPWHVAWLRVAYTLLGALVAFAVSALLWPVHARVALREKMATILQGAGVLYSAIAAAALQGANNQEQVHQLDRQLHDLRRGVTQQMEEARSELTFARFNEGAFQEFVDQADQIRRRLTAIAENSSLDVHADVQPNLLPSLPALVECTARSFSELAEAVRSHSKTVPSAPELEQAVLNLESDLARLREQRVTAPFTLDRMLPFWSFVFNLREVARDLKQLEATLGRLE